MTGLARSKMAATPAETNNTKPTCKGHHEYVFSRCQVRYEHLSQVCIYTPKKALSHVHLGCSACPADRDYQCLRSKLSLGPLHGKWTELIVVSGDLLPTLNTIPTASLSRKPAGASTSKPPTISFSFSSCSWALHTDRLAGLRPAQRDLRSAGVVHCARVLMLVHAGPGSW